MVVVGRGRVGGVFRLHFPRRRDEDGDAGHSRGCSYVEETEGAVRSTVR